MKKIDMITIYQNAKGKATAGLKTVKETLLNHKKATAAGVSAVAVILAAVIILAVVLSNRAGRSLTETQAMRAGGPTISQTGTGNSAASSSVSSASASSDGTASSATSTSSSATYSGATSTPPSGTSNTTGTPAADGKVPVTSVDFPVHSATLKAGGTYTLTAKITPSNATDKSLSWSTTNGDVATVDGNGVVTAHASGSAYIRATNTDGQRDTFTIHVSSAGGSGGTNTTGGNNTTGGSTGGGTTGGAADTLHEDIPQSEEVKIETVDGAPFTLNVNAFTILGNINTSSVSKYLGDDIYVTMTSSDGTVVLNNGYFNCVDTSNFCVFAYGLETYKYSGRYWLKPLTYTVNAYCKQSDHSLIKSDRPSTVHIVTFTFSVYERGFSN